MKGQGITGTILTGGREVVVKGAVMFILLYFLLASGDLFLRELLKLSPGLREKKQVVEISRTIEGSISRYFFTVTLINFSEGFLLAVAMYLIGMPDPILWGVMATLLIYIPYIGPLIGIAIVAVVSFLTFSSTGHALLAPAIYAGLEIFQGYFMTPLILGVRFEINRRSSSCG